MRDPSWFGRRCQCCARCGGHLFEYFFSPDGHFGLVNVLENAPRQGRAGEGEVDCPGCGARYRLLDRLDPLGKPVVRV